MLVGLPSPRGLIRTSDYMIVEVVKGVQVILFLCLEKQFNFIKYYSHFGNVEKYIYLHLIVAYQNQ